MGSSQDERPVNFLAFCLAYFEALICGMCAIHEMSMNMLCCAGKYAKVGRNDKKKVVHIQIHLSNSECGEMQMFVRLLTLSTCSTLFFSTTKCYFRLLLKFI